MQRMVEYQFKMAVKDGRHKNKNLSDSQAMTGIGIGFPTLDGNQISSDEEQHSDTYIGVAFGSTYWNKGKFDFHCNVYT